MDLGQIQVKSALGQPLLAEIPVQQATPAELQQLSVRLASGDASSGGSTMPLHVAVVDGGKRIRITSDAAINDPFMNLLIENQKNVHEFTILLDPPGSRFAPQLSHGRSTPHAAKPSAVSQRPVSNGEAPTHAANGQWTVERGQNLSMVARQTAPAGVDIDQMLLALKQANPDAFYHDNINTLKAGVVLRIPSQAEAQAVAVAAAIAEVRRQNGAWRSGTAGNAPTTVADAGIHATESSSPTTAVAGSAGDHLALVPAKHGGKANGTSGGGDSGNALRQDLQRSQETLTSLQQQDQDLKSRLKDLIDINGKNQRLLALKDNEIAELQQKLAAARKAAGMPAEPVAIAASAQTAAAGANAAATPVAKPADAGTAVAASTGTAPAASAPAKPSTAPTSAATATVASQPAPAAATPRTAPVMPAAASEEHWYSQLWIEVLGGIVLLLVLLGLLRGRRGKTKPAATPPSTAPSLADRFGVASPLASTGDAELDSLLDELAEHPDDIALHLELVSLYYGRRDVEHFEAAAEAMHAHVSDLHQEEWQAVVHMGEELAPSHPLFAQHGGTTDKQEAHHAFDIDQYAAEPAAAPTPTPTDPPPVLTTPRKVSEHSYDFDLKPTPDNTVKPADEEGLDSAYHAAESDDVAYPPASSWQFDESDMQVQPAGHDTESRDFSDDPVDTKLDLARAYIDMGDPEGARAMLEEVMREGSQAQTDVARRLLDDLH